MMLITFEVFVASCVLFIMMLCLMEIRESLLEYFLLKCNFLDPFCNWFDGCYNDYKKWCATVLWPKYLSKIFRKRK